MNADCFACGYPLVPDGNVCDNDCRTFWCSNCGEEFYETIYTIEYGHDPDCGIWDEEPKNKSK